MSGLDKDILKPLDRDYRVFFRVEDFWDDVVSVGFGPFDDLPVDGPADGGALDLAAAVFAVPEGFGFVGAFLEEGVAVDDEPRVPPFAHNTLKGSCD